METDNHDNESELDRYDELELEDDDEELDETEFGPLQNIDLSKLPKAEPAWAKRARMTLAERTAKKRTAVTQVLEKTDRLFICSTNLKVDWLDDPEQHPGWTTGAEILINFNYFDELDDDALVALWGLNYHELAHVIMTPRIRGGFRTILPDPNTNDAFNIMEDWRIETQMAGLFLSLEPYFKMTVNRLILKDHELKKRPGAQDWAVFTLVVGRMYLDQSLRIRYERKFRQELQGRSRRMEIDAAIQAGQAPANFYQQLDENLDMLVEMFQPEIDPKDPNAEHLGKLQAYAKDLKKTELLKLLDLRNDDRVDAIIDLTYNYVQANWSLDKDANQDNVFMVRKMAMLLPLELLNSLPMTGLPLAGNEGSEYSPDTPSSKSMTSPELRDEGRQIAREWLAQDKEEMDRLREKVEAVDSPDVEKQIKDEKDRREQDGGDDGEEDGDDGGEGNDSSDGDADGPSSLEGGDEDGWSEDRDPDSNDVIVIDPRQNAAPSDDDEDQDNDEDGDDTTGQNKTDEFRRAGQLTGGAGKGSEDTKAKHMAQLTSEELAKIDEVYRNDSDYDALLNDQIKDMLASPAIQKDMQSIRRAVGEAIGEDLSLDVNAKGAMKVVPGEFVTQRNRLVRYLNELRSLLEGSWRDEQPSGKLNLRRLINSPLSQRDTVFRTYIPDEIDEAGLEMVVLLDRSSSMASAADHASKICWMIASAAKMTGGRVHVIGFADPGKDEVLVSPTQDLPQGMYVSYGTYGGTNIADALEQAHRVLSMSGMPNRALAIITDGGWSDLHQGVEIIRRINALDAETILMLMGMHLERDRRGCTHVAHVNDINRAGDELKKIITRIQVNAVRRVNLLRGFVLD